MADLRKRLRIDEKRLEEINKFILDPDNELINNLLEIVEKHGGPETITGYFGGIGQPNDYPLKWVDEYLHYFTNYGIRQVLNVNSGTILTAYLLHKLGIDNEFKISVYMGNDNPFAVFWTLMAARLHIMP